MGSEISRKGWGSFRIAVILAMSVLNKSTFGTLQLFCCEWEQCCEQSTIIETNNQVPLDKPSRVMIQVALPTWNPPAAPEFPVFGIQTRSP
tara:strand:- start:1106 stop:1378 length:273 start_codon:yes stop_codon:yes gene_type:complete